MKLEKKSNDRLSKNTTERPDSLGDRPSLPGYRLGKFEVYNWGIFDGAVYSLEPRGQTTLLVGENGSGKSTLVDALLTLLVRPQTRNYNVAAGASKNERDERTYIRGAHDRTVGEDGRPQVQYLRSGIGHYTVLLATFTNERTGDALTISQVLYLNSENAVERIYAYCNSERSIVQDLSNLNSGSTMARQLRERSFETTSSYTQFFHWLQRQTGLKAKSMDVFNQTVAVKDVQRLDLFIRQHMLEKQPWGDRVAKLLTHFTELSEAHRMLVRVRQQNELLMPVVEAGRNYRSKIEELEEARAVLVATPLYFAEQIVQLLEPLCAKWTQQIQFYSDEMRRLEGLLERWRNDIARLEMEIENAGGDRLRQLPGLIEQATQMAKLKSETRLRYESLLDACGITTRVTSPDQFHRVRTDLHVRRTALLEQRDKRRKKNSDLQYEIGRLTRQTEEDRKEAEALERRKGNLPESLMSLRDRLCRDLKLAPSDVPFAAELLEVKSDERKWEASIEQVLHGFARSLLVADEYYSRIAGYVDATHLTDDRGYGQRLVYLRVSSRFGDSRQAVKKDALSSKLKYRDHPLSVWVKAEILERFDFTACETIEEFKKCSTAAMTVNRHIKKGNARHEKDDRSSPEDRRHFVLGWDNREKRLALREAIRNQELELNGLAVRAKKIDDETDQDTRALEALEQASRFSDFDQIDSSRHEYEASQLKLEKLKLEESNDVVRELRSRVTALRAEVAGYQQDRDENLANRTRLEQELRSGRHVLDNSSNRLSDAQATGVLETSKVYFELIGGSTKEKLTIDNLAMLPEAVERKQRERADALHVRMTPISKEVTSAMSKYLRGFPEENLDLDADIASLDSFCALYERISSDDLPRHEERFKNRLNEKVLHEVGLLNSSLENDRQEIREKIEQLNGALKLLEWKPGTHMRLEATDVADREIQDFRRELANCLSGTLDGTPEANEATFVRIEKLVGKLRDEANDRWRDKVVDVRNWFNFAARELVTATGQSRSYYDGGTGQSGGEKGKLAFLVLVAAIAYQYDLDPDGENKQRFHFVMVDEMFSRSDDQHAEYALDLFQRFGLQLLIVAPLDAKVRVTEPYVGTYVHVIKNKETHRSELISITAEQLRDSLLD